MIQKVDKAEEKSTAEDRIAVVNDKKYEKIKTFNSSMYYISFIVLNLMVLVISLIYLSNQEGIEKFSIFWDRITCQGILLLVGIFVLIMIMKTLPNFIKIYSQTKKVKFGLAYRSVVVGEYYSMVTMYSNGEMVMSSKYLNAHDIETKKSIDIVYSKSIFNRISTFLYNLVVIILGMFLWMDDSISIWLVLLSIIPLIINASIIIVVISFSVNKKSTINFIGNLVRFLYRYKIVKNYEKTYNNIIDNLLVYNKNFKQNKILIFTEIMAYIVVNFLRCVLLYYSLITLEIGGVEILGDIVFRYVILDLILSVWPLQKGALVFEFLFYSLFIRVFFSSYVCWGIIILRTFDYLLYILQYLMVVCYDFMVNKFRKKASK